MAEEKKVFVFGVVGMSEVDRLRKGDDSIFYVDVEKYQHDLVLDCIRSKIEEARQGNGIDFSISINVVEGVLDCMCLGNSLTTEEVFSILCSEEDND